MQMVKRIITVAIVFWLALIILMPKTEIYYLLEQELEKKDIKISSEEISEGWFSVSLKEPLVYVKGVKVATVEEITLFTLLFYTKSSLKGVALDSSLERFSPTNIEQASLIYSVADPARVLIKANGDFGDTEGSMDISQKSIKLKFSQKEKLGMIASKLKKDGEGWLYETSF